MLSSIGRQRLRLADLGTAERRLVVLTLAAGGVVAALLLLAPLGLALPFGSIDLRRSDAPAIGRIQLAASLIGVALALGALAFAASWPRWRLRRLTLVGLAFLGLFMTPSVIGQEEVSPIPFVAGVLGLVAAAALVVVAILDRPRRPAVRAVLAALPPVCGLVAIVTAGLPGAPATLESRLATSALEGTTIAETPLVALAVWGVIEYSRGMVGGTRAILQLRSVPGVLLPLVLIVKVAALAALVVTGSDGATGLQLAVRSPTFELPFTIAWAAVLTLTIGWWLLGEHRVPFDPGSIATAAWLVLTPLIVGLFVPTLLLGAQIVPDRVGIAFSPEQSLEWAKTTDDVQTVLLAVTPAVAGAIALIAGIAMLAGGRDRWRGAGAFLVAYSAWTLPGGLAFAVNELTTLTLSDVGGGPLGNINSVTLDIFITVMIASLTLGWLGGWQSRIAPAAMLAILLLSTVIAFGGAIFEGSIAAILFWLGLTFPFATQFLFDADGLNEAGPDRHVRVLRAVGTGALALAMIVPLVALRFVGPERSSTGDLARALFLVPFAAVLLAAAIAAVAPTLPEDSERTAESTGG